MYVIAINIMLNCKSKEMYSAEDQGVDTKHKLKGKVNIKAIEWRYPLVERNLLSVGKMGKNE